MELLYLAENPAYEEMPVGIRTFIDSPQYMNAGHECWEPIKVDLEGLFQGYDDPQMNWKYNEACFDEGISGGKSYKSSVIITYMLYRTLILREPQEFFHLAKGSGIYFMNMSIGADQAKKVVFGEICTRINNAPWFKSRNYLPNSNVKSELQFPKNITVIPGNSKETNPLGFNLLGAVMDEAAFYTETETHDVAEKMFNALYNRIKTRFGRHGMVVMISSPRYIDDFIEKKMEESKTNKEIYAVRRASWESKPKEFFSGKTFEKEGYIIPIEFETLANRNFDTFKRDIMAIPSLALEPFFKQWILVEQSVSADVPSPFNTKGEIRLDFRGKSGKGYYIHIDLSLVTDCTGLAMCHEENGIVILDLALQIKPPQGGEIDLSEIKGIVLGLKARGFDIRKVTYDQFASQSSIQELNKQGFNAERYSLDKDLSGYSTLKDLIYAGKFKMFKYEPLLKELQRLELVRGKRVDHPVNSSKDVSDAVAGCVYQCVKSSAIVPSFGIAGGQELTMSEQESIKKASAMTADGRPLLYGKFSGQNLSESLVLFAPLTCFTDDFMVMIGQRRENGILHLFVIYVICDFCCHQFWNQYGRALSFFNLLS